MLAWAEVSSESWAGEGSSSELTSLLAGFTSLWPVRLRAILSNCQLEAVPSSLPHGMADFIKAVEDNGQTSLRKTEDT